MGQQFRSGQVGSLIKNQKLRHGSISTTLIETNALTTIEGHSIEVHDSRRPFDRLTTIGGSVKEQPRWKSVAVERGRSNILCDPVALTFDLLI